MALGRLAVAAATSLACCLIGERALALGRLLGPAGAERPLTEARVAVALAPRQTTVWWSLELQGPRQPAVLVVPAMPGAAFDPVSPRWLESLERATAPRIVLPGGGSLCGAPVGSPVHDTSKGSPPTSIDLAEFAVVSSLDQVAAFARARGVEFALADREALAPYASEHRFVTFAYDVPELGGATEPVRMTWRPPAMRARFELIQSDRNVLLTLWTIAGGRAKLPQAREYLLPELAPAWKAELGRSDYPERRHAWLASRTESAWLIEAAGEDVLYDWRVLPLSAGAVQPVINGYFGEGPGSACTHRVLHEARNDGGHVALACAKGSLGVVELPAGQTPCVESPDPGEIAPDSLRCGVLDDLALALADQDAGDTWVTRHSGVNFSRQTLEITGMGSVPVSPIVPASSIEARCGSDAGSPGAGGGLGAGGASGAASGGASGAAGTSSGNGGWGGMGGVGSPRDRGGSGSRSDPYNPPPTVHEGSSVEVGCTSSGGDADCGGDSSSSGDDDSCSGDSGETSSEDSEGCGCESSDEESGGDDCGGDSSNEGGDDCGGDSSSDGGDDCSGDSSTEGGDDCGGDSSGGEDCSGDSGGGDCSGETASRPRRFRPRVSAVTLVLCAIALFARRSGRRDQDAVLPR